MPIARRPVGRSWRGTILRSIGGSRGRGHARRGRLPFVSAVGVYVRIILRGSMFEDAPRIIGNVLDPRSIVRVGSANAPVISADGFLHVTAEMVEQIAQ